MKVLFVAANPLDTTRLSLDEEMRSIAVKVSRTPMRDEVDFVAAWAARPDDLLHAINEHEPSVIHFAGHGQPGGIIMESDGEEGWRLVSTHALSRLMRIASGKNLRVVVLNSCYSFELAKEISEHIPAVVGSRRALGDGQAIAFSSSFYRALCFGVTVREAVEQGCTSILLEGLTGADDIRLVSQNESEEIRIFVDTSDAVATSDTVAKETSRGTDRPSIGDPARSTEGVPLLDEVECAEYVRNAVEPDEECALVYLDIDGLLAINSVYGEAIGDNVLKECASLITRTYRDLGVACRLRGDQFVIIDRRPSVAPELLAQTLLKRIRRYDWSAISPDLYVTATASIAYRTPGEEAASWILRAIIGVKEAKRRRKNSLNAAPIALPELHGDVDERWAHEWLFSRMRSNLSSDSRSSLRAQLARKYAEEERAMRTAIDDRDRY